MRKHAVAVQVGSLKQLPFRILLHSRHRGEITLKILYCHVVLFLIPKKVDGIDSLMAKPVVAGIGAEVASNDPG